VNTLLVVLVFVVQPDKSLRVVQELPVENKNVCIQLVKQINSDRTHPLVAACYADAKVGNT